MLFSNRNEFLRDSSRIESIPPNILNDIVSESGMTRSLITIGEKKIMKPHESPRIRKKLIRGDSGDSWPVWNRGITYTICSEYHNTTVVAYSVPYIHNMLQLS